MSDEWDEREALREIIEEAVRDTFNKFLSTALRNEDEIKKDIAQSAAWKVQEYFKNKD